MAHDPKILTENALELRPGERAIWMQAVCAAIAHQGPSLDMYHRSRFYKFADEVIRDIRIMEAPADEASA